MNRFGNYILVCVLLALLFLGGCERGKDVLLDDLLELEEGEPGDATVDELQEAVRRLEDEVRRTVEAGVQLVNYQKMTAQRFMSQQLYGLAADFFRQALDARPTNKLVAYNLGICTSQVARSQPDDGTKTQWFEKALDYHLYALELDGEYQEALYAVSVLYIFELEKIGEAEKYLERLLTVEPEHIRGMFLLARVHNHFGRIDDAVALYDEIIRKSNDEAEVEQAKKNRAELSGVGDGY
jgi:tetratricopeptide (TPR) repeat protein